MRIARDAWPFIGILAVIALPLFLLGFGAAGYFFLFLLLFVAFFFRDPERNVPLDPGHAVSPADGRVMRIDEIADEPFIGGPAKKVVIFLSVFNVHINRCPIAGEVAFVNFRPGKMLPAYKTHASDLNERNSVGIKSETANVIVNQITGLIARRIVCNVKTGDKVFQGQRYGLIKFGSCTELTVPASSEILVKPGDTVRGGTSILAKFNTGK